MEIRPNRPSKRKDFSDLVYLSEREKFAAIVDEVETLWKQGAPVLVGTRSIEKSEKLSHMLRAKGIPHKVLNAKYHEMEAQIISQAGRKGAVTIATNMAGRGTDIVLGGNPADLQEQQEVAKLGGLPQPLELSVNNHFVPIPGVRPDASCSCKSPKVLLLFPGFVPKEELSTQSLEPASQGDPSKLIDN